MKAYIRKLKAWLQDWMQHEGRQIPVLLVVVVTLSFSIVYTNVQTFGSEMAAGMEFSDTRVYLNLYFGEGKNTFGGTRLLVPFLASLLPRPPAWLLTSARSLDPIFVASFHFGAINFVFLVVAAVTLYFLQRGFGLPVWSSIVGAVLFLSLHTIVRTAGLPLVDTAYYCFLALCLLAVQRNRPFLLCVAFGLGVFAKELLLLVAPMIMLSTRSLRERVWLLVALLPGGLAYLMMRVFIIPSPPDRYVSGAFLTGLPQHFSELINTNRFINLFLSFGLLWIPALYALFRCDVPADLKRWLWFIPILLVGMMALGASNISRHLVAAFPVVIPLASWGLSEWVPLSHRHFQGGSRRTKSGF